MKTSFVTGIRKFATNFNKFSLRTHNCGELRKDHIGQKVNIYGWLLRKRYDTFFVIHDKYGFVQAKISENSKFKEIASTIKLEDVLKVTGVVRSRGKDVNPDIPTGEIEIDVENLEVLNPSNPLPFPIFGKLKPGLETDVENKKKMTYRYIELRKSNLQKAIHLRAEITRKIRRSLEDKYGFIEIETPTLATHTPGGAAEFIVPTKMKGESYALPQSPQLYKQLLMIGQMDRYYQIARCYRDEAVRGDRQPEFTQVDLELSFTSQNQVLELLENIIVDSWPEEMISYCPNIPFSRMTFEEAMSKYGSDKPDLRIPWIIEDCSNCFDGNIQAYGWVIRSTEGKLPSNIRFFRNDGKNSINKEIDKKLIEKFNIKDEDCLIVGFSDRSIYKNKILSTLGFARTFLADILNLRSQKNFAFTWITDFPLFVESEENPNFLESAHHPFTAPIEEDKEKLLNLNDLRNIRAQHYDLVVNGIEMGGGSIRIHNPELQKLIIEKVLKFPIESLNPFLHALSFGAPPHGGFALGLDRYVTCLASGGDSKATVRDVIAFPKTKEGRCLMMKTPFEPDEEMKKRYGVKFVEDIENPKVEE